MRPLMCVSHRVCMSVYMRGSNERCKCVAACKFACQLIDICLIFSYARIAHVYSSILTYREDCVVLSRQTPICFRKGVGKKKNTIVWRSE